MKYLNIEKSIVIFSRKKKHFIGNFSKNISIKNTLNRNNIQCTSSHVMCFSAMVRERVRECESEGEGDDDEVESKRKRKRFGVESKVFEVVVEKRRGKTLLFIVESKRGVSSWVRLGLESVGIFMEGLDQCVKDGKDDKWEKGWKEKGRRYSMVREVNKAGSFIRLGVVDAEEKRFSICIPRGGGGREGWSVMAETVRNLTTMIDRREEKKEEPTPERVKVEMGKS